MIPHSSFGSGTWLASYPKSGNTWFLILLANLRSGSDQPVDINGRILGSGILSRGGFDNMTMLESGLLTSGEVDSLRPAVCQALALKEAPNSWIKVHDAWRRNPAGEPLFGRSVGRAAIYVVRDPRDVAVSLAHYNGSTIDRAIEFMNTPNAEVAISDDRQERDLIMRLGDWSGHVLSWLDQGELPVQVVTYEALKLDTVSVFGTAMRFAGEEATPAHIERAVRHSAFRELSKQERTSGFRDRPSTAVPFFRRGEAGGWRDELTAGQAARIAEAHGQVMERLGYLP
jgi:aryl sulfotransferase